ncbi:MAG TPA: branched-chain amino acid ABC transporter permease [Candidatus Hydrogenedentes bacterium]|nr:branched-chain amino acid ABC transporter permease [Candidatus Hydrogenedentota bacterium]HPG68565.1 branched-chain amino acid ABC transporter permease [Candidatus Hydrogenedentota bacterium]
MNWKSVIPVAILLATIIAVQGVTHALDKDYYLTQLTMAVYYSMVVIALCLVMGYAGQVSLGHGAFFAVGGYTTAFLTTHSFSPYEGTVWAGWLKQAHVFILKDDLFGNPIMTVTPWAAFTVALALTALVACLIGYPALRLTGHYLAMATLGFGLIVYKIILGTSWLGAADGITNVPSWTLVKGLTVCGKRDARIENYYIACGLVLLLILLLRNLLRSRVGRALQAMHDRETAANTMGINTSAIKLKAFVLSAMVSAVAGVFFTHYTGGIGPSEAGALKSVRYVALTAAGGMTNLWSVAAVSTTINFLSLRDFFGSYDNAVFGGLLIIIISVSPEGPLKPLGHWIRRVSQGRAAAKGVDHGAA